MRKLAIGLSAMALGGCIFLTPPTGLRVGDHSQEFAHLQQQAAAIDPATLEYASYDGPDFYGEQLHVTFEQRIRGQKTFDSLDELIECMQQDLRDVEAGLAARRSLA